MVNIDLPAEEYTLSVKLRNAEGRELDDMLRLCPFYGKASLVIGAGGKV
jgi:hypothetical protein